VLDSHPGRNASPLAWAWRDNVDVASAAWAVTIGLIILLLGLDLAVGALRAHPRGPEPASPAEPF
jgi:hypothetical protein